MIEGSGSCRKQTLEATGAYEYAGQFKLSGAQMGLRLPSAPGTTLEAKTRSHLTLKLHFHVRTYTAHYVI